MARNMDYREENRRLQREINYRVIGEHMREVRHKCGMTQKVLAERMGMDTNYYRHAGNRSKQDQLSALYSVYNAYQG